MPTKATVGAKTATIGDLVDAKYAADDRAAASADAVIAANKQAQDDRTAAAMIEVRLRDALNAVGDTLIQRPDGPVAFILDGSANQYHILKLTGADTPLPAPPPDETVDVPPGPGPGTGDVDLSNAPQ
jgi:hypothetical protein